MKNRTTILLLVLFFGGLVGLWLAELARVPTAAERQRRAGRVLPELIDVAPDEIGRVEIASGETRLVFERQGDDWRLVEPIEAAADRSRVEALIQSLKSLPKPAEAVPLTGRPEEYGLKPPVRTIRLYREGASTPLASLDVGKTVRDGRYVRPAGSEDVEVADAPPFAAIEQPASDWRDRILFHVPAFDVARLAIQRPDHHLAALRDGERWRLSEPIDAPASTPRMEGLIGGLTALRVIEGPEGFVKDDVKDFAPYGLDHPSWTIALAASQEDDAPEDRVAIGKAVPERPGHSFARRTDSDDVVIVRSQLLDSLETDPYTLRSRRVADLDPAKVDAIRIQVGDIEHLLVRRGDGWRVVRPVEGAADSRIVAALISELNQLEITDLIDPEKATNPGLDPPSAVVSVWEGGLPVNGRNATIEPNGRPRLELRLGRRNAAARVLFARESGDPAILALPFDALKLPLGDRLAFLDHRVLPELTEPIGRIVVSRDGVTTVLQAPANPRDFASWRMLEPVEAAVDAEAVGMLNAVLMNLQADRLIEQGSVDRTAFGFERPELKVRWSTGEEPADTLHELILGDAVPDGDGTRYAMIAGRPLVFTLGPNVVPILEAECHDRNVLDVEPSSVERIVFRVSEREAAFRRTRKPFTGGTEWTPEPGSAPSRINPAEIDRFLASLALLRAVRFRQYQGAFPSVAGLDPPDLTIALDLKSGLGTRRLRFGKTAEDGLRFATTEPGSSGPVLLVPAPGEPWISPFRGLEAEARELPENPFVSEP